MRLLLTLAGTRHVAILDGTGGGIGATPLGVSKVSVVEPGGKDQRIALDEYSRLAVRFFGFRSKFDRCMGGQR